MGEWRSGYVDDAAARHRRCAAFDALHWYATSGPIRCYASQTSAGGRLRLQRGRVIAGERHLADGLARASAETRGHPDHPRWRNCSSGSQVPSTGIRCCLRSTDGPDLSQTRRRLRTARFARRSGFASHSTAHIEGTVTAACRVRLDLARRVRDLPIHRPHEQLQGESPSILGALDDKIELNRRTERDAGGNCTNAVHVLAS